MNTEDFDFTYAENPVEAGSALLFLAGFVLTSPEVLRLIRTEAGEHTDDSHGKICHDPDNC